MAGEVLLTPDPNARRQVWLYRETPQGWQRDASPVARDMSSLGLEVVEGELWLTGLCWWPGCGSEEEMRRRQREGPLLFGVATRDLESWRPLQWRLKGAGDLTPIDPEVRVGRGGGVELWYYGVRGTAHADPMGNGQHEIHVADLREGNFHERGLALRERGVGDPAPLLFNGEQLLFATTEAARRSALYRLDEEGRTEKLREFDGISVPYAFVRDGELWLLASKIVEGRQTPVLSRSRDGRSFTEFEEIFSISGLRGCSSPVGAEVAGQTVIFCVEEPTLPG